MAQFDPKKVLRQVSNDLLRQLFEHCHCPIDVPWAELSEMEEAPRRNIEIVLHDIGEMAIEDGIRAIVEEARRMGEDDLIENIEILESRHDKTVWTLIHSPDIWQLAVRFARADSLSRGRYLVEFDGSGQRLIKDDQVLHLQLAYALTAHKAQGSEFPCVVVLCHKSHYFADRNWLYTAVTRASRHCILMGDRWGLRNAVKKNTTTKRRTFLGLWGKSQTELVEAYL